MSEIGALTRRLREELAAQGEEPPPYVPIGRAALDRAAERFSLPAAYREMLTALGQQGFTIAPGPFQAIVLYAAPDLEAAQVGFRGPRAGDESFVAPHGWHRSWVVIATDAGDPYFLDVTKADARGECPVYTAMHGTGTWEPLLAASSVEQYLRILDVWLRIVVPHHDRQNPDEPLDELHTRRLAAEIARIDPAAAAQWQQ